VADLAVVAVEVLAVQQELLALQTQVAVVVQVLIVVQLGQAVQMAVQASSLFPTHPQLNYSVVELLLYQAVNISIPLLLLVH
jgi:hypothetical protein